jgi:PEP-CTERM motif
MFRDLPLTQIKGRGGDDFGCTQKESAMKRMNLWVHSASCLLLVAAMATMLSPQPVSATISIYTFDDLNAGNLAGQDNWVSTYLGIGGLNQVAAPSGIGNASTYDAANPSPSGINFVERVNDGNFSFPVLSARFAVFQADLRATDAGSFEGFYLSQAGGGLGFKIGTGGGQFEFDRASGYTLASFGGVGLLDWLTVRVEADLVANTASVFYKDLTTIDTSFTPVSGMQNMLFRNGGPAPSLWNNMGLDLRQFGQADNLLVESVPEPSVLFLLGSGALLIWRRVRRQA